MNLRLIRSATLQLDYAGVRVLVDPMLDAAGARPAVPNTENERRNPLVELPEPAEEIVAGAQLVLVSHLHQDHFDSTAARTLPDEVPLICQPEDEERLRGRGLTALRPLHDRLDHDAIAITRTAGEHGTGAIGAAMAPVSGFVLEAPGEPTLYIAGDTIACPAVETAIAAHAPDVIVVNASGARFLEGDPIVMTADDVVAITRAAPPETTVVVVHLEAINHCLQSRAETAEAVAAAGLSDRVRIPADGERYAFGAAGS